MQLFSPAPTEMFSSLWRNRELVSALIRRDVVGRYRGSIVGIFWSFFNPVLMLAVYTFVFSVVFKARWGVDSDSKADFALVLFPGMIIFNLFAECINRAPTLILANTNYVKKVVFPLEILPWVSLGSALFHAGISLCVWLVAYIILVGAPHVSILFLPLVVAPLILLIMGISLGLAALGVYIRDIAQITGVATTTLMFLSPIFYSADALPEAYRSILFLNPLTPTIEQTRSVLYWGQPPDITTLLVGTLIASILAFLGFAWFQKTRKGFADVL